MLLYLHVSYLLLVWKLFQCFNYFLLQVDQVTDRLKLDLAIKDAQPPISMFNINTLFWVLSYKKLRYTFSKSSLMHFGSKKSIFILWKGKLGNLSQFLSINALKNWPLSKFCSAKIHLAMFGRTEGISGRFLSKAEINYLSQNAQDSLWRDCLNSIKFSFILINLLVSLRLLPLIGGKIIMLLRWVCEWLSVTIELYCPYQLVWI